MVEIAKALAFDAAIVIMDEPTSALSDSEVARLFRVIADLRKAGTTVLYISHKMNEVFTLADRVTVLRDGQFVATAARAETSPDQVVRWMVGREIAALNYVPHPIGDAATARGRRTSRCPARRGAAGRSLRDITFSVRAGEVAGRRRAAGGRPNRAARSDLRRQPVVSPRARSASRAGRSGSRHPDEAIKAGIAMVTEDRKTLGLFDRMTVAENITIRRLPELTIGPLDRPASREACRRSGRSRSWRSRRPAATFR